MACVAFLLLPLGARPDMMARRSEKARSCSRKKDKSTPPGRRPRFHRITFWNCWNPRGMGRASRCVSVVGVVMLSAAAGGYRRSDKQRVSCAKGEARDQTRKLSTYQVHFQQLLRGRPNRQEGGLFMYVYGCRFMSVRVKVSGRLSSGTHTQAESKTYLVQCKFSL